MYSIFNTLAQFDSVKADQPIYIYGAKTIAIRACMYLEKILNGEEGNRLPCFEQIR